MSVEIDRSTEALRVAQNKARARANGLPATLTLEEWLGIIERFGGMCAYCEGHVFETLDHLIPLTASGGTVAENCLPACSRCNALKSGKVTFDMHIELPLEAKVEQVRYILKNRKLRITTTGNEVLLRATRKSMGNKKRSPLGTRDTHLSLTKEVIMALNQIADESDQGEPMSRFVDNWLREHPQIREKLEQAQQKGTNHE